MSAEHPSENELVRANILSRWRSLPLHEQTAVLVEQIRDVLGDERGEPIRQQLGLDREVDATEEGDSITKKFAISGVSRADLRQLNFTDDEIAMLDDGDMERIARKMEDHYVEMGFWDDLDYVTRRNLANKSKHGMGAKNTTDTI